MRWEALLWSVLAITAPAAARIMMRRADPTIPAWAEPMIKWAGWLHGLILPYAALLVGSIPGGLVGLYAISFSEWVAGTLACLLGLTAVLLAHRLRPGPALDSQRALDRWKDEPRFALYRATGALLLNDFGLGAGLGFMFSLIEWLLSGLAEQDRASLNRSREMLYRSGVSTVLFLLTRNFWLTAGTQLVFFILLEYWAFRQAEGGMPADEPL